MAEDDLTFELLDPVTGLFTWGDRADRVDLYQTGLAWPLVSTIMNGFGAEASWPADFGRSKSATLFRALQQVSAEWTAFYIKHQDDAYGVVDWVRRGLRLSEGLLAEFETNPADEGGASFLGCFPSHLEDMVLFSYQPAEFLRISLFGRMRTDVPQALADLLQPAGE